MSVMTIEVALWLLSSQRDSIARETIPKLLNVQWCHDNGENSTCFVWLQNLRLNDLDMNSQIICLLTSVILTDFADLIQ